MAEPRLRFGRERATPASAGLLVSLLLFVGVLVALGWTRSLWGPRPAPAGPWFEIRGEVPRPGVYAVETLHGLLGAAGAPTSGPDRRLVPGELVVVEDGVVTVSPTDDPLIVGLPLDPNTASAAALDAVPGVSSSVAAAIVADRAERGPFRSLDALRRVPGVGDDELEALAPFAALSDPGPVDLESASEGELDTLPGIGPVLAARIVADRSANGPFGAPDALTRVPGIGPELVERVRPLVTCGPTP